MEITDYIVKANEQTNELYATGRNHKGQRLSYYKINGHKVLGFTKAHANNIYRGCMIDLNLV